MQVLLLWPSAIFPLTRAFMTTPSRPDSRNTDRGRMTAFFSRAWWQAFRPARTSINNRERLRLVTGALIGIFLTALFGHLVGGMAASSLPWLVAPMGAS